MPYDRFLIAPSSTGLQTDLVPWLIMDDAFSELDNVYAWRGRIRKRFGSRWMGNPPSALNSQLRINVGIVDGGGSASGTVPGTIFQIGQMFSIGSNVYTVVTLGNPGGMLSTGGSTTELFDTTTGTFIFTGAASGMTVYFYPSTPVMGLSVFQFGPTNNQPTFGFDQQFAYTFTGTAWTRVGFGVLPVWHGTDANFFWTLSYEGTATNFTWLFVSNFFVVNPNGLANANDDPIWYYDPLDIVTSWHQFNPIFLPTPGAFVVTALIIIAYKDRLIFLSTIENDGSGNNSANYQRARWSAIAAPTAVNAWYEPNTKDGSGKVGIGGGFLDAATQEKIISAEFVKDQLIVYFEKSTWSLVWTGNQEQPFYWIRLNVELGSQSTFSIIPLDKYALAVGNTGIHACNGSNVERIDQRIPDKIFTIQAGPDEIQRIQGIRDYYVEMIYWTFPSDSQDLTLQPYPSRVLVYNYENKSWAFNDDTITCFGYFEQQTDLLWQDANISWEDAEFTWNSGVDNENFRQVIAGNQQGFVFIVDADFNENASVLYITNISTTGSGLTKLTIINHNLTRNLPQNDYIFISGCQGITGLNNLIDSITVVDVNTITLDTLTFTGAYTGGGNVARVSNYNIVSKQWNPYKKIGANMRLAKITFVVQSTEFGEVTVNYQPGSSDLTIVPSDVTGNILQGTNILSLSPNTAFYPQEQFQSRLWHSLYFFSFGPTINIQISMSAAEITTPAIAFAPFVLEGIVLYTKQTADRMR